MERRIYFIVGDVLACIVAGASAAWLTQLVVPGDWFALFGMVLGMGIGMTVGMLTGIIFSPVFGAHEVMLPASLAGMMAGMLVGMVYAMGENNPIDAAITGAELGLVCLVFTYILQTRMQGEAL